MTTTNTASQHEVGAWVYHIAGGMSTPHKVTVVGYDAHGYALYAEGWVRVCATSADNMVVMEDVRFECPECHAKARITEPFAFRGKDKVRAALSCGHVVRREAIAGLL